MARCEDFPCCGHEPGCCPDFKNGRQLNMRCVCGAEVPIESRYSICESCMRDPDDPHNYYDEDEDYDEDYDEDEDDEDFDDEY